MKIYSKAPDECTTRVQHLIKCFHQPLRDAGLRVDVLSVVNDDPDSPALTHQGYSAAAVIRVLDSKQRAKGSGDVEIVIDEAHYLMMNDAQKDALLDHEIYHVELRVSNKTGRVKLDEHGRPKCGMRKHDIQIGHFIEIAERHGPASMEVKQMTQIYLQHKQVLFDFAIDSDLNKRLESATREPSERVKAIAREIQEASPAVRAAAKNFVEMVQKHGASVTISSGESKVRIDADGVHNESTPAPAEAQ